MEDATMLPLRFRSRVVEIEAMLFDGTYDSALSITAWAAGSVSMDHGDGALRIKTPEGMMRAERYTWIIKESSGEFYPCQQAVFLQKYEPTELSDDREP